MSSGPQYRERRPAPRLGRHVACLWTGRLGDDGRPYTDRVLPDGCVDLVWDGRRLFVAGPDTGPVPVARRPGARFAGLRFRPGLAPTMLGVAASDLLDQRVDASDLLGRRALDLAERMSESPSAGGAALALEQAALAWVDDAPGPDPLVEGVVATLRGQRAGRPVAALARDLGVGERRLLRRCTVAVGYGPKTLHRILRFRRFLSLVEAGAPAGLADLAAEAGYADQAHLSRECRRLAGAAPASLLTQRAPPRVAARPPRAARAGW